HPLAVAVEEDNVSALLVAPGDAALRVVCYAAGRGVFLGYVVVAVEVVPTWILRKASLPHAVGVDDIVHGVGEVDLVGGALDLRRLEPVKDLVQRRDSGVCLGLTRIPDIHGSASFEPGGGEGARWSTRWERAGNIDPHDV